MLTNPSDNRQKFSGAVLRQYAELVSNIQRDTRAFRALFRDLQTYSPETSRHLSETHHLLLEIEGRCCTVTDMLHEAARKAEGRVGAKESTY